MRTLLAIAGAMVLAGCAQNPASMSADQLNALAKDKNASLTCSKVIAAGVTATLVLVNVDEIARVNGSASVTADCLATITTVGTPPTTSVPVPVTVTVSPAK